MMDFPWEVYTDCLAKLWKKTKIAYWNLGKIYDQFKHGTTIFKLQIYFMI